MASVRLRLAAALIGLVLVVGLAFWAIARGGIVSARASACASGLEADARLAAEVLGPDPFDVAQRPEIRRRWARSDGRPVRGSR